MNPEDARHLLVVDDDDRIRDLLKEFLARAGFRVTTAPRAIDVATPDTSPAMSTAGTSARLMNSSARMPGTTDQVSPLREPKVKMRGRVPMEVTARIREPV